MTSPSTVMKGTAIRPVFAISSSRAAGSSATFLAVNAIPWDERNSFAAWHDCQVLDQYTVTCRLAIVTVLRADRRRSAFPA
jgi:hypothetical protein